MKNSINRVAPLCKLIGFWMLAGTCSLVHAGQPRTCSTGNCFVHGDVPAAQLSRSKTSQLTAMAQNLKAQARAQDVAAGRVKPNAAVTGRALPSTAPVAK